MSRKPSGPITLEALAVEVARLCRYVDSLGKSAERLAGRLEPFEGEKPPPDRLWLSIADRVVPNPTLENVMLVVQQIHAQMQHMELDFSSIRATVDQISNDSWSREDLKKYLDQSQRRDTPHRRSRRDPSSSTFGP